MVDFDTIQNFAKTDNVFSASCGSSAEARLQFYLSQPHGFPSPPMDRWVGMVAFFSHARILGEVSMNRSPLRLFVVVVVIVLSDQVVVVWWLFPCMREFLWKCRRIVHRFFCLFFSSSGCCWFFCF